MKPKALKPKAQLLKMTQTGSHFLQIKAEYWETKHLLFPPIIFLFDMKSGWYVFQPLCYFQIAISLLKEHLKGHSRENQHGL